MLPLYEAKMLHLYDTRWATYEPDGSTRLMTEEEKAAHTHPLPRYWVADDELNRQLEGAWDRSSFLGWRDVCRSTDARTMVSTLGPRVAYGHKWMLAGGTATTQLQALWSSFAFDFIARQKLGGTSMSYATVRQIATPARRQMASVRLPLDRPLPAWIDLRVDRLNGWIPDPVERSQVRAELDALMFHLYGLGRDDVSYVMDTFPIVKRKDEAAFGTYRTKELILAAYDAMGRAQASGTEYRSPWTQEVLS